MTYKLVKLKEVLEQYKKLITLSSDIEYKQVTIKMYWKWVILRWIQKWFDIQTKNQYLVKKWQFIISKIDARNWAFWKIPNDLDWAIISNSFASFDINTKLLNIDYLILFSKTEDFVNACIWKSEWTTNRQSVKIDDFLELEISLPTLEEQEIIVKKVESINGKIEKIKLEKNKKYIKILREQILKQAIEWKLVKQNPNAESASILLEKIKAEKEKLIKEWKLKKEKEFAKITEDEIPFEIPKNWVWCRLGEICHFQWWYAYKSEKYIESSDNQIIRLWNVKNDNLLLTASPVYISNDYANETINYNIKNWDILITMTWTKWKRDYCFTLLVKNNEKKLFLNQRVWCLRFNNILNLSLINIFLKSDKILDLIFEKETWTANQWNIGSTTILETLFPLPPLEEQKRIVEKIEEFEEKLNKLDKLQTKQLKELEALKNAVLDKALSGELI